MSVPSKLSPDKPIWVPDSKGCFLVKSAYLAGRNPTSQTTSSGVNWSKLWNLKIPERTKVFLWRLGANALPTRENLRSRLHIEDPKSVFFREEVETPCHLFLGCPASKSLWFAAFWGLKTECLVSNQPEDIIKWVLDPPIFPDG